MEHAGISEVKVVRTIADLATELRQATEPVLIFLAGAWLKSGTPLSSIPASATGRALMAFGAVRDHVVGGMQNGEPVAWARFLKDCGGDVSRRRWWNRRQMPECRSLYLEPAAAHMLGAQLDKVIGLPAALERCLRSSQIRAVHMPALDVHFDPGLRIVQLVTTIQIGGAERVTLDIAAELRARGLAVCVAVFGRPTRLAFPEPPAFADLSTIPYAPEDRAAAVARLCRSFGADLVHAHLIRAREAQAIREHGVPLLMTIHNMPQSWPAGLAADGGDAADLFVACSNVVADAARTLLPGGVVRTVWNGIDPSSVAPSSTRAEEGRRMRERFGIGEHDFVLVAVANPRRQKRLDRLPEIVALLRERFLGQCGVHLLLAGAPAAGNRDAEEAVAALSAAIELHRVQDYVHWTGPVLDIAPILAAGDVLISVSEFEGLSLAHLEALAAGLPVIATDVGGTREIARQSAAMRLLPPNADAGEFVGALQAICVGGGRQSALPKSFTRYRMASRYNYFYSAAIQRAEAENESEPAEGIWLITNNFSTGGAQSSARRLLAGFANRGIKVRAAVVQEHPEFATVGREALSRAGIRVVAILPPGMLEAEDAVCQLARMIGEDPPQAVVFWNLLTSYKMLLTEALSDCAIYDVSPGEMYFESLEASFANPRAGLPFLSSQEYGRRLAGAVVKYESEVPRAEAALGVPVRVIRNGVPLAPARSVNERRDGRLIVGTAARLSPQKRLEDLLEAVRMAQPELPPFVLRIAGGVETGQDAYAKSLRRLARGLPVEWCGELPDTSQFLSELDVFLMISEPAGCPNASLEAMAAGLPVIATDVGGASEQVIHRETGLLVPRRDPRAFADAIIALVRDSELARRLGENARDRIESRFSVDRMVDSYAELFFPEAKASQHFAPEDPLAEVARIASV